jgi:hypothetical protein
VEDEKDDACDEHDVNETSGNVKCEKPNQPKYDQYCGDHSKHVFIPCFWVRHFLSHCADVELGKVVAQDPSWVTSNARIYPFQHTLAE